MCLGGKGTLQRAHMHECSWFLRAQECSWVIKKQYTKFNVGLTGPFQILKVFRCPFLNKKQLLQLGEQLVGDAHPNKLNTNLKNTTCIALAKKSCN